MNELTPRLYQELRAIAGALLKNERPGHTLQPTALVHEAFIRLAADPNMEITSREHFLAVAGGAIRRVLVDHARTRDARKRGGSWSRITLDEGLVSTRDPTADLLDLDDALDKLAATHERAARVAELRLFGGLTVEQAGHVMNVSRRTATQEWSLARAWLTRELKGA